MVTIKIEYRDIAEIAEKSPGYSVQVRSAYTGEVFTLANIAFGRYWKSGRRNKAIVEFDYVDSPVERMRGRICSDSIAHVLD